MYFLGANNVKFRGEQALQHIELIFTDRKAFVPKVLVVLAAKENS